MVAGDPPAPIEERYAAAVDVLVALHRQPLPGVASGRAAASTIALPPYDLDAFLIEAELLLDWYLPHRGATVTAAARAEFVALWRDALQPRRSTRQPTWVLRDYHSPNLLWLPEREGIARVGLLDFQDALMGPPPTISPRCCRTRASTCRTRWRSRCSAATCKARLDADPDFDTAGLRRSSTRRSARSARPKILGIFARLDRRDGKPQYLRHIPRVWRYLRRSLIASGAGDAARPGTTRTCRRRRNDTQS